MPFNWSSVSTFLHNYLPGGIAGVVGTKVWEWCSRRWKQRLSEKEELLLLIFFANKGTLEWKQEGGVVSLPFQLLGHSEPIRNLDKPDLLPKGPYRWIDQGEVYALISKDYIEIINNGYHRRLTDTGFRKAKALCKSMDLEEPINLELNIDHWLRMGTDPETHRNSHEASVETSRRIAWAFLILSAVVVCALLLWALPMTKLTPTKFNLGAGLLALFAVFCIFKEYFAPPKRGEVITAPDRFIKTSAGLIALASCGFWIASALCSFISFP